MRPKSTMAPNAPTADGHADRSSGAHTALVAGTKQLEQINQSGRNSESIIQKRKKPVQMPASSFFC